MSLKSKPYFEFFGEFALLSRHRLSSETNSDFDLPKLQGFFFLIFLRFSQNTSTTLSFFSKKQKQQQQHADFCERTHQNSRNLACCLLATGQVTREQVDAATAKGETMLSLCVCRGRSATSLVQALIAAGADLNKPTWGMSYRDNATPLLQATTFGHDDVVALLVKSGADLERANNEGDTPLVMAVRLRRVSVVRLLLDAGATVGRVNRRDAQFTTALHFAAFEEVESIIQMLIAAGADLDALDSDGHTPLSYAAWYGRVAAVRTLLLAGANAFTNDPSRYAVLFGGAAMLALFLAAGVTPTDETFSFALRKDSVDHAVLLAAVGARPDDLDDRWSAIVNGTDSNTLAAAKKRIELAGFRAVCGRMCEICVALASLRMPAPQVIEILQHACAPFAGNLPYHYLWDTVVCVKKRVKLYKTSL